MIKKTRSSHNNRSSLLQVYKEIYVVKIFQIPRGTKGWSLSLVKLKTSPAFLKMNSITDIYSEFS